MKKSVFASCAFCILCLSLAVSCNDVITTLPENAAFDNDLRELSTKTLVFPETKSPSNNSSNELFDIIYEQVKPFEKYGVFTQAQDLGYYSSQDDIDHLSELSTFDFLEEMCTEKFQDAAFDAVYGNKTRDVESIINDRELLDCEKIALVIINNCHDLFVETKGSAEDKCEEEHANRIKTCRKLNAVRCTISAIAAVASTGLGIACIAATAIDDMTCQNNADDDYRACLKAAKAQNN